MQPDWNALKADITEHARGKRDASSGRRVGNMAACARADSRRYAEINAEAMAPIHAEAKARLEAAQAEARARAAEQEHQAAKRAEQVSRMIDQRVAHALANQGKPKKP